MHVSAVAHSQPPLAAWGHGKGNGHVCEARQPSTNHRCSSNLSRHAIACSAVPKGLILTTPVGGGWTESPSWPATFAALHPSADARREPATQS